MAGFAIKANSRAQVSLEFLVLLTAFLAFMSIWLSLIFSVKDGVSKSLDNSQLGALASDVREAADAVCLMGEGSAKEVEISGNLKIELAGKMLVLSSKAGEIKKTLRCPAIGTSVLVREKEKVIVQNLGGKISLSN
jgi:uncharacterized protein (UPF0333 family)